MDLRLKGPEYLPLRTFRDDDLLDQDAVAGLKVGQQTLKGLGGGPRLRGQVGGLGLLQVLSQASQARRVLAHQKLCREVQGVERPGEGSQLRLVQLQAHHLADAELHPVQPDGAVLLDVREHEEEGQLGRRLGRNLLRSVGRPGFRPFVVL